MVTGYDHLGARSTKAVINSRYLAQIVSLDKLLNALCSNTKTLASVSRTRFCVSILLPISKTKPNLEPDRSLSQRRTLFFPTSYGLRRAMLFTLCSWALFQLPSRYARVIPVWLHIHSDLGAGTLVLLTTKLESHSKLAGRVPCIRPRYSVAPPKLNDS